MTDPYRRDPKDIALADGHEGRRDRFFEEMMDAIDCEMDHVPWETETTGPPIYTCGYCGAQMT